MWGLVRTFPISPLIRSLVILGYDVTQHNAMKARYIARLVVLACVTVSGLSFLYGVSIFAWIFFENFHRFPVGVVVAKRIAHAESGRSKQAVL